MQIETQRLQGLTDLALQHTQSGAFSSIEWSIRLANDQHSGFAGMANSLTDLPAPAKPIYRIYSMTKPIVSVLALKLIEAGHLALANPVSGYLPAAGKLNVRQSNGSITPCRSPMTIEHLLTHRAGFSYDFLPDCAVAVIYRDAQFAEDGHRSLTELVNALLAQPLCFEPGTEWKYGYSIDVLARVLEVASGTSLQQLLQDHILDPCGMSDTGFNLNDKQRSRLMPMFGQRHLGEEMLVSLEPQVLKELDVDSSHPLSNPHFARGGHGLYSSMSDYMKFASVLLHGKTPDGITLLSTPMIEFMWQNRIPNKQLPLAIGANIINGYGWNLFGRVVRDRGQVMFLTGANEGGWAGAACTYFWVDPELQFSGTVMTQYLGATVPLGDFFRSAAYSTLN